LYVIGGSCYVDSGDFAPLSWKTSATELLHGSYGLRALEPCFLTPRQIEAVRRNIKRITDVCLLLQPQPLSLVSSNADPSSNHMPDVMMNGVGMVSVAVLYVCVYYQITHIPKKVWVHVWVRVKVVITFGLLRFALSQRYPNITIHNICNFDDD
jgi:hypothetical protein